MQNVNLTHHFLIAMPAMADPHFSRTLTYICEHNDQGALGIVVNRPLEMTLQALLEQVSIPPAGGKFKSVPIHFGGPVQVDRGFVQHSPLGQWQSTLAVSTEIGLTTSKDILQAVARGEGPGKLFVTLGYAGWAPGQLEHERYFRGALGQRLPGGQRLDVCSGDALAIAVAQQRFEHDAQADGQARNPAQSGFLERGERVIFPGLAGGELEFPERPERVVRHQSSHELPGESQR